MKLVISGFKPFGGLEDNASAHIAEKAVLPEGINVERHILDVTPEACDKFLAEVLPKKPDLILSFGVAAKRNKVCLETTARNRLKGIKKGELQEGLIIPDGAETLKTRVSGLALISEKLNKVSIPGQTSHDAGRYICNYLYYKMLLEANEATKVLFVHVPMPSEQVSFEKLLLIPEQVIGNL